MITKNIPTLKIHKLSQEQYNREVEAGRIDENAIYLTPDDGDNTGSSGGGVTSWNDLEDRPFYEESDGKVIVEEQSRTFNYLDIGVSFGDIAIEEGKDYIVTWNGDTYTCKAVSIESNGSSAIALGNLSSAGYTSNNEPFVFMYGKIISDANELLAMIQPTPTENMTITLSVTEAPIIHKLDVKFLPSVEEQLTDISEATNIITWDGDTTGKEFVDMSGNGTELLVKVAELADTITLVDLIGGTLTVNNVESISLTADNIMDTSAEGTPAYVIVVSSTPYVYIMLEDFSADGISLTKGVWFTNTWVDDADDYLMYVSSLQISKAAFGSGEIIKKLDNKFIDAEWMAKSHILGNVVAKASFEATSSSLFDRRGEFDTDIELTIGDTYLVTADGLEYTCECYNHVIGIALGLVIPCLGNSSLDTTYSDMPDTGESFFLSKGLYGSSGFTIQAETSGHHSYTVVEIIEKGCGRLPNKFLDLAWIPVNPQEQYEGVLIPEATHTSGGSVSGGEVYDSRYPESLGLMKEGDTVIVTWDNIKYTCLVKHGIFTATAGGLTLNIGMLYAGNAGGYINSANSTNNYEDTGEPFCIVFEQTNLDTNEHTTGISVYVARSDQLNAEHTFSIYAKSPLEKLPKKYLDVSWNDLTDKPFHESEDGTVITLDEKFIPDTIARLSDIPEIPEIPESPEILQSDWSQNDKTQQDYIKKRTHWTEIISSTIVVQEGSYSTYSATNSTLCNCSLNDYTIIDAFDANKPITVTFNGNEYECVPWETSEGSNAYYIGNRSVSSNSSVDLPDTGEPFCLYIVYTTLADNGVFNSFLYTPNVGTYDFKAEIREETVKKLSEKFIPDTIARTEDVPTTLPNPTKLTFTGATTAEYNGSVGVNVRVVGKSSNGNTTGEIFNNYTDNVASGQHSHAEGNSTTASEACTHAEGYKTKATSHQAHAEGGETTASGQASHAEGFYTQAAGVYSHSEGYYTTANQMSSHAEGTFTKAIGRSSHAEGGGDNSVTITISATEYPEIGDADISIYGSTATGEYSHAEGDTSFAFGNSSHAEGRQTKSIGRYSHSEGVSASASGTASHSEGNFTKASGEYTHAEGSNTTASGYSSHAEGQSTLASGSSSHAEGVDTTASGTASHAEGSSTIAASRYQHVQGKYNIEDASDKYAHIVGNGTADDARSNAHTVDWDGNAWYAGDVYVGGTGQDDTNANRLAKMSDVPTKTETWRFTLEDGTVVEKVVYVG